MRRITIRVRCNIMTKFVYYVKKESSTPLRKRREMNRNRSQNYDEKFVE